MILSASASQVLATALGRALDEPVVPLRYRRFPDGELLVEVDPTADLPAGVAVEGDRLTIDGRAVVVASTASAEAHIEALLLQDVAVAAGADPVVTVVPYLGYARQEVAHEPGQPASARAVARALSTTTDRVVTVDPHEPLVADYFDAPCEVVSAVPALADALTIAGDRPLVIAPDEGAFEHAVALRDAIGTGDVDHFEKHRRGPETVELTPSETDVEGREVVLVDDIVATGSTIAQATALLLAAGAATVRVACVHALLVGGAYSRLHRAGVDELVATDTIEGPVARASAAEAIADVL
ncbi:MAG: ribose-phosphate diphosphokinase [Halobacteriales archaeon]